MSILSPAGVLAAFVFVAGDEPAPAPVDEAETTAPTTSATEPPAGAPPPVQRPTRVEPPVSDAAWEAVQGRQVVVTTSSGSVEGELTASEGDTLVIIAADGQVLSVPKHSATGVRVAQPPPKPAASASPSPEDPTADELAGLQAPPAGQREKKPNEEDPPESGDRKAKREEKRKKRGFAILGAFTAQGATYTHWRGDGINDGHASYAMDFGVGANLTQGFGMYVVGGGLLGTRLEDKRVNANYGRLAFLFLLGGKYYFSTIGAGVAFSRLKWKDPVPFDDLQKDVGLAIPFKIVGKIPLPKNLYIGIGLTYEFAAVRKFSRFVNGIGGQIVFGRW